MSEHPTLPLCPRCEKNHFTPYGQPYEHGVSPAFPALSRVDNETYICSECGTDEAMRDFARVALSASDSEPIPVEDWPVA